MLQDALLRLVETGNERPTIEDIRKQILSVDAEMPPSVLDAHIARGLGTSDFTPTTVVEDLTTFTRVCGLEKWVKRVP